MKVWEAHKESYAHPVRSETKQQKYNLSCIGFPFFLGSFLRHYFKMKERKISNKACIYLDDFTACTKVGDGYECHTIVEKQWVENLRKEKQ